MASNGPKNHDSKALQWLGKAHVGEYGAAAIVGGVGTIAAFKLAALAITAVGGLAVPLLIALSIGGLVVAQKRGMLSPTSGIKMFSGLLASYLFGLSAAGSIPVLCAVVLPAVLGSLAGAGAGTWAGRHLDNWLKKPQP